MMTPSLRVDWMRLCVAGMTALGGCAGVRPVATAPDVAPAAETRRQAVSSDVEARRDAADVLAAQSRCDAGDWTAAQDILERLLARNPRHVEARRLLADLHVVRGHADAAERELRQLLAASPRDAQAHHSLGLLWESQGRPADALDAYRSAAQLEPSNELYALSVEEAVSRLQSVVCR